LWKVLGAKLHPSDDQKARIEPVIRDRQQKLAELRSDASMQKKRKLKSIFLDSDKKIKALLNDEQKKQYAQVEQEMRDQIRERMQNRAAN
jgi:periplasmic protein CpxP/Spy